MRRASTLRVVVVASAAGALAWAGGCSSGAECALDTDCDLFQRCDEGSCVPLGADDAGASGSDDAGVRDGSPRDAGRDAGPPLLGSGRVTAESFVVRDTNAAVQEGHRAGASFVTVENPGPCDRIDLGECELLECPNAMNGADAGMAEADAGAADGGTTELDGGAVRDAAVPLDGGMSEGRPHAGVITIRAEENVIRFAPVAGAYPTVTGDTRLWNAAVDVAVEAEGDEVPAFEASVPAPLPVVVQDPALDASLVRIDRNSPHRVRWRPVLEGVEAGELAMHYIVVASEAVTRLQCRFDVDERMANLPPSVLRRLPSGMGRVEAYVESTGSAGLSRWDVRLVARTTAWAEDGMMPGAAAQAPAVFE